MPDDLHDIFWVANTGVGGYIGGETGQLGTTAHLVLPSTEYAISAHDNRVASIAMDAEAGVFKPVFGPHGVTIIVRDLRSGDTISTFDTMTVPEYGAFLGSRLVWTGKAVPGKDEGSDDGRIWSVDVADPGASPSAIVTGDDDLDELGSRLVRQRFHVSGTGQTLISAIGGPLGDRTYVFDAATLTLRGVIDGLGVATTDRAVLTVQHGWHVTDKTELSLVDIDTEQEIGQVWDDLLRGHSPFQGTDIVFYAAAPGENEIFVSLPRDRQAVIASVADTTGVVRDILAQEAAPLWLSEGLSSRTTIVLLPEFDLASSFDELGGRTYASTLDPETGNLSRDVFVVGAP